MCSGRAERYRAIFYDSGGVGGQVVIFVIFLLSCVTKVGVYVKGVFYSPNSNPNFFSYIVS